MGNTSSFTNTEVFFDFQNSEQMESFKQKFSNHLFDYKYIETTCEEGAMQLTFNFKDHASADPFVKMFAKHINEYPFGIFSVC
jgi:hypothetical protein